VEEEAMNQIERGFEAFRKEAGERIAQLERENAALREALTFYGDCQTYGLNGGNMKRVLTDAGALARHALHKKEQP
jgi:hypothetical protein